MKKGFTLIELLAVIVVLAIIALIVTPVISRVIKGAKKGAAQATTTAYVKAIDSTNQASMLLDNNATQTRMGVDINDLSVEVNGKKPEEGFVDIVNNKVIRAVFCIDNYIAEYFNGNVDIEETDECKKKVTYVTYDVSDSEDEFAELKASEPDSSWNNYIRVISYGDFISEVASCNKTDGVVKCISSNDNLEKGSIVKESNNGMFISSNCQDITGENLSKWHVASMNASNGYKCLSNDIEYDIVRHDSDDSRAIYKSMTRVFAGERGRDTIRPYCSFEKYTGLWPLGDVVERYINMSKKEFLNLTIEDILDLLRFQMDYAMFLDSNGTEVEMDEATKEALINQQLTNFENMMRADESTLNRMRDMLYTEFKTLKLTEMGGYAVYYDCYHDPADYQ